MNASDLARFLAKIRIDPHTECWLWTSTTNHTGYGFMVIGSKRDGSRRMALAHRLSCEHFNGPIAKRAQVHHICKVRRCVNPAHLRAVTATEHLRIEPRPQTMERTHCKYGHPFAGTNLYIIPKTGRKVCRACKNRRERDRWDRTKRTTDRRWRTYKYPPDDDQSEVA